MGTMFMEMRQRGQLTLTPRLQQSVRLLQLSALEFTQELQQALATNPFLEEVEDEQEGAINSVHPAEGETGVPVPEEFIPREETVDDTVAGSSDTYGDGHPEATASRTRDDGEADWTEWTEATPSLRDHLQGQLQLCNLSARDRGLCQLLIEALDDDGYLRQSFTELAALVHAEPSIEEMEWSAALKLVQSLEPAGIGARDLRECLLAQLPAPADCTPEQALARRAIIDHLQSLARRDLAGLERWLEASADQVRAVYQLIRRLDPHPG